MTRIEVGSLTKQYGNTVAVDDVSFEVAEEEFLTIVGPSGCGKTTTLRCIAGLESPTDGEVRFDGEDMTDVPVHERDLAMMFQSIALYPHMTLEENIAYPLKVKGVPASVRRDEAEQAATVMQIYEELDKYPGNLSGGQQQRVALARTVVGESVAFLMDEPLSDLDAKLKVDIRKEIQRIHRRLGEPAVYVTHDQEEAMTMSDRIAIMNHGIIEQIGDVDEIYQYPKNTFVAEFIGNPSMNFMECGLLECDVDSVTVELDGRQHTFGIERVDGESGGDGEFDGDTAIVGIRPQSVGLSDDHEPWFSGNVPLLEPLGDRSLATIDGPQGEFSAIVPRDTDVREGESVDVWLDQSEVYLFDPDTTALVARGE